MGLFGGGGGFFGGGGGLFGGGGGLFGGGGGLFGGSSGGGGGFSSIPSPLNPIHEDGPGLIEKEIAKELLRNDTSLIGDLYRIGEDAKNEFNEIMTVGFYEMVIKGNSDWKSSYEIKEEAQKIIGDQALRYDQACCALRENITKLNQRINKSYDRKNSILKELNENLLSNTEDISLGFSTVETPSYNSDSSFDYLLNSFINNKYGESVTSRTEKANEYLEDAKDYAVQISGAIANINRIQAKVDAVNHLLDEEDELLNILTKSMQQKRELKYENIAAQLHSLLLKHIVNQNGDKNTQYVKTINDLKESCRYY